jgi:hypothetical protein
VVVVTRLEHARGLIDRAKRERCGLPSPEEAAALLRRKAEYRTSRPNADDVAAVRSAFARLGAGTVLESSRVAGMPVRRARRAVRELAESGELALTGSDGGRWKTYEYRP